MQVRAVQSGMVLVVDEADKAPTHVTCILKNIIGRGDVTLADGRRIVHSSEFVRSLKIFDWSVACDCSIDCVHTMFVVMEIHRKPCAFTWRKIGRHCVATIVLLTGSSHDPGVIPVHPDFRMIALANRPGFPFLGNDFYAALGTYDILCVHSVLRCTYIACRTRYNVSIHTLCTLCTALYVACLYQ